jgi:uncharacterized membrane protein
MKQTKTQYLTRAAIIAALYVALTYLASLFGLSSGVIQLRLSEALTVLPVFTQAAVPGLFVGCILANLLTGAAPYDVLFGSLATLIGAIGTYFLRRAPRVIATVPPILANTVIVPFILIWVYEVPDALWFLFLTIFIGEALSAGVLGVLVYSVVNKNKKALGL